jgi:hypothetical protein
MIKIVNVKDIKYKIVIKENKRVKQLHLAQDVITVFSQQRLTTSRISFTENNYWIAKVVFRYRVCLKSAGRDFTRNLEEKQI